MGDSERVPDGRKNRGLRVLLVVGVLLLVAGIVFWGARGFHRSLEILLTRDAVQVLSMQLGGFFQKNPQATPEEVHAFMVDAGSAAGITLPVDPEGRPRDRFGTPFRVERHLAGKEWVVTVTSAGPDRVFGTSDDIRLTDGK